MAETIMTPLFTALCLEEGTEIVVDETFRLNYDSKSNTPDGLQRNCLCKNSRDIVDHKLNEWKNKLANLQARAIHASLQDLLFQNMVLFFWVFNGTINTLKCKSLDSAL